MNDADIADVDCPGEQAAVSVVLATRDRPEHLARTLESFVALIAPEGGWQLLIVDNGSNGTTGALLRRHLDRLPLTILDEPSPGKSRALNRAIGLIRGDLVVLTDDDVLPEPDWLVRLQQAALAHPDAGYFGGTILPAWSAPPPRWLNERAVDFGVLFALLQRRSGPCDYREVYGPNMAVRRSIFLAGYRFSAAIGPDGSNVMYPMGSEWEFNRRLHQDGYLGRFVADARVRHIIRSEQVTEAWVLQRAYRSGLGTGLIDAPSLTAGRLLLNGVSVQLYFRLLLFRLMARVMTPLPPSARRLYWLFKDRWFAGLAAAMKSRSDHRPVPRGRTLAAAMADAADPPPDSLGSEQFDRHRIQRNVAAERDRTDQAATGIERNGAPGT